MQFNQQKFKELRGGDSPETLAKTLFKEFGYDTTGQTIRNVESGKTKPDVNLLAAFAQLRKKRSINIFFTQ